jgi:polysaccharide export outer membrane protein
MLIRSLLFFLSFFWLALGHAEEVHDFLLGAGDSIHITVYRNQDLTLDTRVNEDGSINYPLAGTVMIGGLSIPKAEELIATRLKTGGFIDNPQVNIAVVAVRGNTVSVLGQVNHPGLYPVDPANLRLSQVLAIAGGIAQTGGEKVILKGVRDNKPIRKEINVASIYLDSKFEDDMQIHGGDEIFVPMAPMFYIYGEVQRPGANVIQRNMTVMQALAQGGGLTLRGTQRGITLHRTKPDGTVEKIHPALADKIQPNDVIYVSESLF